MADKYVTYRHLNVKVGLVTMVRWSRNDCVMTVADDRNTDVLVLVPWRPRWTLVRLYGVEQNGWPIGLVDARAISQLKRVESGRAFVRVARTVHENYTRNFRADCTGAFYVRATILRFAARRTGDTIIYTGCRRDTFEDVTFGSPTRQ